MSVTFTLDQISAFIRHFKHESLKQDKYLETIIQMIQYFINYVGCQMNDQIDLKIAEDILACMNNIYEPVVDLLEPANLPLEPYEVLEDDRFNILVPHLFSLLSFIVRYHIQFRNKLKDNPDIAKSEHTKNYNTKLREFLDKVSQREMKDDKYRYKTFLHINDIAVFGAQKFKFKPNCSYFVGFAEFFVTLQQFRDDLEFQQRITRPIAQLLVIADKSYNFFQLSEEQQAAELNNPQSGQHQKLILKFGQNFAINLIQILKDAAEGILGKVDGLLDQLGSSHLSNKLSLDQEILYKIYAKVNKILGDAGDADRRAEQTEFLRKQGVFDFGGPWVSAADILGLKATLDGVTLHLMAQKQQSITGNATLNPQQASQGISPSPMWQLIQKTILRSAQLLGNNINNLSSIMPYSFIEYESKGEQRQKQPSGENNDEIENVKKQQVHPVHQLITELLESPSGLHEVQFALGIQLKYEDKIELNPESEYEEIVLACALRSLPSEYTVPAIEAMRGINPRLVYYAEDPAGLKNSITQLIKESPDTLISQDIRLLLWLSQTRSIQKESAEPEVKKDKKGGKQEQKQIKEIETVQPEYQKSKALQIIEQLLSDLSKSELKTVPAFMVAKSLLQMQPKVVQSKKQDQGKNIDVDFTQLSNMKEKSVEEIINQIKALQDDWCGAFFSNVLKCFLQSPEQMFKLVDPLLNTVPSKLPGGKQTGDWAFLLIISLCLNQKFPLDYRQQVISKASRITTGFIPKSLIKELLLSSKYFQVLNSCLFASESNKERQKEYFLTKQQELQRQYSDLHIYNTEDLGNMSEDEIVDMFERRDVEHWNEEIRIKNLLQYLNEGEAWQKIKGPGVYFKGYDKAFSDHSGLAYMQNYIQRAQYLEISHSDLIDTGYNVFGRLQVKLAGFELTGNDKQTALKQMLQLEIFSKQDDQQDIIRHMD